MKINRFLFFVLFFNSSAYSQVRVQYQEIYHQPQEDFYTQSIDYLFEFDELWLIDQKSTFIRFLQTQSWPTQRIDYIRSNLRTDFTKEIQGQILSFYHVDKISTYIVFDSQLQSKLFDYEVNDIYRYLLANSKPGYFKYFLSEQHFEQSMNSYGLSQEERDQVKSKLIEVDGVFYLIFSKRTWSVLPNAIKFDFIKERTMPRDLRKGLNVELQFLDVSDIQKILINYVQFTDVISLEKKWLADFRNGKLNFSLVDLMPPVVQRLLGKYSIYCGPNCLNAAISFYQDNNFKLTYLDGKDLQEELKNYQALDLIKQAVQPGDLIIIKDRNSNIVHAAVYVFDNIVFTKNGASKFSPYLFQKMDTLLSVYPIKNKEQVQFYRFKQEISEIEKSFYTEFLNPKRYCEKIFLND